MAVVTNKTVVIYRDDVTGYFTAEVDTVALVGEYVEAGAAGMAAFVDPVTLGDVWDRNNPDPLSLDAVISCLPACTHTWTVTYDEVLHSQKITCNKCKAVGRLANISPEDIVTT